VFLSPPPPPCFLASPATRLEAGICLLSRPRV
jgi:hypothetical protein